MPPLHRLPEARWRTEPDKFHGLTGHSLAKLLRPFGIKSRRSSDRGSKKVAAGLAGPRRRGYFFEDFQAAFERYLPPLGPEEEAEAREAEENPSLASVCGLSRAPAGGSAVLA